MPKGGSVVSGGAGLDEAVFVGEDDCLDSVTQAEFGEDAGDM
jgi:hypothetical protein